MSSQTNCLVIVGAGPVGMVSALLLKDYFKKVILLERQAKEKFLNKYRFAYPIVFTPTAIKVLEKIGVWEQIMSEKSDYDGIVLHKNFLGKEFEFAFGQDRIFSHWRGHIIEKLYERTLSDKLEIIFNANVKSIDFVNNLCTEATLGSIEFDLLLGADGIHSFTRHQMSKCHPEFSEDTFNLLSLDRWHAYRLPAQGILREKFGGGVNSLTCHIYLDNLTRHSSDTFKIVTTSMSQPAKEINILVKYSAKFDEQKIKLLNEEFFAQFVDSVKDLNTAWDAGYSGKFEQVQIPTFHLNSVLLVGDSAHGFESAGDLINIGITSVASFCRILGESINMQEALREYDEKIGESIRFYSSYALRRGQGKTSGEMALFAIAKPFGLVGVHPSLYGVYQEDFEIQKYMTSYKRDLLTIKLLFYGVSLVVLVLIVVTLLVRSFP